MLQSEYICQSCGTLIDNVDDFGTNSDFTKNQDYCIFCYHKGAFSEPHISKIEMVGRVTETIVDKTSLPKDQAYDFVVQTVSSLKRWQ